MKHLQVMMACCMSLTAYAMEEIPLLQRQQEQENTTEYTIEHIAQPEWKKNTTTLDWSHKELTSIAGFRAKCIPASPSQPSSFPFDNLTTIILAYNKLKGEVNLNEFSKCTHLQHLDLSHNELTTTCSSSNPPCQNLRSLNLSYNTHTPSRTNRIDIGLYFKFWPNLKHLDLSHNEMNITGVRWSEHPVWPRLDLPLEHPAHLPTINLIGNTIQPSDREWLIERYKKEKERIKLSVNDAYFITECTAACTLLSVVPAAIIAPSIPYGAFSIPIGMALGAASGALAARENNSGTLHVSEGLPLYFDEQDNQSTGISQEIKKDISFWQWRMCH